MAHQNPTHLWQLLEAACSNREFALLQHGMHSDQWLRADIAVKKCQRALGESLRPSPSSDDPVTLPLIPLARPAER